MGAGEDSNPRSGKGACAGAHVERSSPGLTLVLGMVVLLGSTVYYYHGRKEGFFAFARLIGLGEQGSDRFLLTYGGVFQCAAAAVLLLLPAVLAMRAGGRQPLRDMGFSLGDWRWGLKVSLPVAALLFPVLWLGRSAGTGLCEVYPLVPFAGDFPCGFLAWEACYLVYYVAWEGTFRGAVQLGLGARLGAVAAMLLQTAVTTLLHAGSPEVETLAALAAGPVLGYVALRSGSILYPLLVHFAAGMATDLACIGGTP